jgi:hypothetical protein
VLIGSGVTFWWLAPDLARSDEEWSLALHGRWSWFHRRPRAMRAYYRVGHRLWGAITVVGGAALLVTTAVG